MVFFQTFNFFLYHNNTFWSTSNTGNTSSWASRQWAPAGVNAVVRQRWLREIDILHAVPFGDRNKLFCMVMMALICVEVKSRHSFCPDASTGLTCQVVHALICVVHQTLRAGSQRDRQLKPLPLPLPSVCLYSGQSSSLGLCDTAATWGPVVTPQTQEIPLLLLRSSVVAPRLCVHFCGTDPVCMCQSRTGLFRKGGYSTADQPTTASRDTHKKS